MPRITRPRSDQIFADRLMKNCQTADPEINHVHADRILVEALRDAGYHQTAETFTLLSPRFWYA